MQSPVLEVSAELESRDNGCGSGCAISVIRYASPAPVELGWRAAKAVSGTGEGVPGQDIGAESEGERKQPGGGGQRQWEQSGDDDEHPRT